MKDDHAALVADLRGHYTVTQGGYPTICERAADTIELLTTRLTEAEAEIAKLRQTVSFFASVIRSGEPWTETCERAKQAALTEGNQSHD